MKAYHIHPRKTGGTALRFLLEALLRPSRPLPYYSDQHFFTEVPGTQREALIGSCDLISGHFGKLGPLVPSEFVRICVLRDPLRRVVSEYNHIVADANDPLHSAIRGMDFVTALSDERFAAQLWNHQARLLVENMGEQFESLTDRQRIECGITFLAERVHCLGLIEHVGCLLELLRRDFGLKVPSALPLANTEVTAAGAGKEVVYNCIDLTTAKNAIDIALYSFSLRRLGF